MQKDFRKGVPPLFVDLRPLYADPDKAAAIEQLCNEFLANLRSTAGSFEAEGIMKRGCKNYSPTSGRGELGISVNFKLVAIQVRLNVVLAGHEIVF